MENGAAAHPGGLTRPDLPDEVSLAEAAEIANCDKKTLVRYLRDGLLEWRDIAPPSSSRPTYRIRLSSLLELRTSYRRGMPRRAEVPTRPTKADPSPRPAARPGLKHLRQPGPR